MGGGGADLELLFHAVVSAALNSVSYLISHFVI